MKQFVITATGAALLACAGAGCASDPGSTGNLQDQIRDQPSQTKDQSKSDQATERGDDSRVVEGPGGAIMIIHDQSDWVQEKVPLNEEKQPAQ